MTSHDTLNGPESTAAKEAKTAKHGQAAPADAATPNTDNGERAAFLFWLLLSTNKNLLTLQAAGKTTDQAAAIELNTATSDATPKMADLSANLALYNLNPGRVSAPALQALAQAVVNGTTSDGTANLTTLSNASEIFNTAIKSLTSQWPDECPKYVSEITELYSLPSGGA